MSNLGQWRGYAVASGPAQAPAGQWGVPVTNNALPQAQPQPTYYSQFGFRQSVYRPFGVLLIVRQAPDYSAQLQMLQRQQQIQQQYLSQQQQLQPSPTDASTAASTAASAASSAAAAASAAAQSTPPLPQVSWTGLAEVVGGMAVVAFLLNHFGKKGGGGGGRPGGFPGRMAFAKKPKHHKKTTIIEDEDEDDDE